MAPGRSQHRTHYATQYAEFDPFYSSSSWFRDYIACCGLSHDASKVYAVVAQIGRHKPILKQKIGEAKNGEQPESECATPH